MWFLLSVTRSLRGPLTDLRYGRVVVHLFDRYLAVPREWQRGRVIGQANAAGVFAAIGSSESLATLRTALASTIVELGLDDIDAAAIRASVPRTFTQAVSRHVYGTGPHRSGRELCRVAQFPRFDGINYRSRYGDEIDNWAVFEPFTAIHPQPPPQPVDLLDADFIAALATHRLAVCSRKTGK